MTHPQPRPRFIEASDLGTQAQWDSAWRAQLAEASEAVERKNQRELGHHTQTRTP